MKRQPTTKLLFYVALALLTLSIALAVASLFPQDTDATQQVSIINDSFRLSPNELRREGLGSFRGDENISLFVEASPAFVKNFSVVTYNGPQYSNRTSADITLTFPAGADYYEAVFYTDAAQTGTIHFEAVAHQPTRLFPLAALTLPAKILFFASLAMAGLLLLWQARSQLKALPNPASPHLLGPTGRRRLLALLLVSLTVWFMLLVVNVNPLGTFENWYTDHARDSYTASLFLKDGVAVFNVPLGQLASQDSSLYKFVTWPEMPHLYPLGSLLLFLPFGVLMQSGADPSLVYKLEIALFLVFAHVCLWFFLNRYWHKDMNTFLKLVGVYIIYVSLVTYAANGMFDSVAFLFALIAITMLVAERYDAFFLLISVAVFFKYQVVIFLAPLILFGVVMLLSRNRLGSLMRNKKVVLGIVFVAVSGATAYLSLPFLMQTRPELFMNGINAFSPNAQIPWLLQSGAALLTLAATLVYALYMAKRNSLLSLSSLALLVPSFMLPFFQNWYLPFIFVYILIPQQKKDLNATVIWLIFMTAVLSFGGSALNPVQILNNFKTMIGI